MEVGMISPLPISFFNEQRLRGNVVLQPKYQRRLVWSLSHKVYLIDTILRKLPMPKFFVEVKLISSDGKTVYNVVDGQQRLDAIFEYIDGKFELSAKNYPYPNQFNEELEGVTFSKLPEGYQDNLWLYKLSVEQLTNATDNEIRDMFVRLNKNNSSINNQELRNALYEGDFKKLVYDLSDEWCQYFVDNKILSLSSIKRMGDAEYTSELLTSMIYGIQNKKDNLDKIYAENDKMDDDLKIQLRKRFSKINRFIKSILDEDLKTTRFKNKSDYYTLFYLFYELIFKDKHVFNMKLKDSLRNTLFEINNEANINTTNNEMLKYYESTNHAADSEVNRKYRHNILKKLLEGFFIETDPNRLFNESERQFVWHREKNKICAICGKIIDNYDDYEVDHIVPWSKGGLTTIDNAQITHRTCNRKKQNNIL